MICKWCGNNMSPSATKCKRCGKEAPALSDCGGFYDIAPRARNAAEAPPANINNASVPYQPAGGVPVAANVTKNSKKLNLILIAAIVAVFVLVLVLFFVLLGKVNSLSKEVETLKDEMITVNHMLGIDKKDKNDNKDTNKTTDKNDKDDKDNGDGLDNDIIFTKPTTTEPTATMKATETETATEPSETETTAETTTETTTEISTKPADGNFGNGLNGSNLPFNPNNR